MSKEAETNYDLQKFYIANGYYGRNMGLDAKEGEAKTAADANHSLGKFYAQNGYYGKKQSK